MTDETVSGDSGTVEVLSHTYTPGETTEETQETAPQLEEEATGEVETAEETSTKTQYEVETAKRMVIDTVEDKFRDLAKGKLSGPELKQWFREHPEIAEATDKSKRVKEAYRTLMNSADDEDETVVEKQKDAPVTLKDIEKMLEERETKTLESRLVRERTTLAEKFAGERKITDEDFTRLTTTADALSKANPDWEYKDALEASQRALFPTKDKPVQVPVIQGAPSIKAEQPEDNVDLTKGFTYTLKRN